MSDESNFAKPDKLKDRRRSILIYGLIVYEKFCSLIAELLGKP
jgi:hypothetical protein